MKHPEWVLLILAMAYLLPASSSGSGLQVMKEGKQAYNEGNAKVAVEKFSEALGYAEEDKTLDPAAARLNLGTVLARDGQLDAARTELQEALKTDDLSLQAKAQYNLGHIRYQQAVSAVDQQDLQGAKEHIDHSLTHFQNALRLEPADTDTKRNFELSQRKKKEIELLLEQQPPQQQQQNQDEQDENEQDQNQDQQQNQQNEDDQNSDQERNDQQQQDGNQEQEEPQPPEPESEEESQNNQPDEPSDDEGEEEQQPPQPQTAEQMTPEEAEMLLEAMKAEEQNQREQYRIRLGRPQPVDKDW